MSHIREIIAREVLDSRGNPTVEVEVVTVDGARGRAIVPSGASTGRWEAVELRDGDPGCYGGKGVGQAVANVRELIAPALCGQPVENQAALDALMVEMDATPNKSRLGANAILGVSLACAHAAAAVRGVPLFHYLAGVWSEHQSARGRSPAAFGWQPVLPMPMVNMISGGLHAGRNLAFQDFLVMPLGASTIRQAMEWVVRVYRRLGRLLAERGYESVLVGDEGGYGPRLRSDREALELIVEAIAHAGFTPGRDFGIAIDVASTHFFADDRYQLAGERLTNEQLVDRLAEWVECHPIVSIEDGCAEDDWTGWRMLTDRLGGKVQLVGDDLFVTNISRLTRGVVARVANAVLVKPNQIGTLTETLAVIAEAKAAGYRTVISARSGETEDTTIAHLAVATGAGQIKIGSVVRSERLAKYNELLRIEEQLGASAALTRFP
jgi:enolase